MLIIYEWRDKAHINAVLNEWNNHLQERGIRVTLIYHFWSIRIRKQSNQIRHILTPMFLRLHIGEINMRVGVYSASTNRINALDW